jgi:heme exporter protein C
LLGGAIAPRGAPYLLKNIGMRNITGEKKRAYANEMQSRCSHKATNSHSPIHSFILTMKDENINPVFKKANLIRFYSLPKRKTGWGQRPPRSALFPAFDPQSYTSLLQPSRFMQYSVLFIPLVWYACLFLGTLGLYLGAWVAPSDFQQGENYRILFIHVPSAWMSLLIYLLLTLTSAGFFFNKHPIFVYCSRILCAIGALFTCLTLVTGSLWGKPMWGTFWVWDARLTSVLILLFIYLGALLLYEWSPDVAPLFVLIGLLNIPIIKFSVNWWNTLHQSSSITQFGTEIHISMLLPMNILFFEFVLLVFLLFLLELRHEIHQKTIHSIVQSSSIVSDSQPKAYNQKYKLQ